MRHLMIPYRVWWLILDAARLVVRAAVETHRNSILWPTAMALRWALHLLAASPWFGLWILTLTMSGINQPLLVYGLAACLTAEALVAAARLTGHPVAVGFWTFRRAMAVHRRWPRNWGDYAGRTRMVQAETGKEPSTPVRWRPLVDHPRLSWLHHPTRPGVVEFLVGPPPDRTYTDLVTASAALAAKYTYVDSIEVDYESDRSSIAVLTITFTTRQEQRPAPVLELVQDSDQDDGQGDEDLAS